MAINDVTTAGTFSIIGKVSDVTVANTFHPIHKVEDATQAGTFSVIWTDEFQYYPGNTPTMRKSATNVTVGTWYAIAQPTYAVGVSAVAYAYLNVSPYKTVRITYKCATMPTYGHLYVGIGNFGSFALDGMPTMTHGDKLDTTMGVNHGYTKTLVINIANLSGNHSVGCAAVSRSSAASAEGSIEITSIIFEE